MGTPLTGAGRVYACHRCTGELRRLQGRIVSRIRVPRPSAAMIVALVALFVALGGTAYAAATIGSGQIIDESIKSQDIKNGEVKNADLGTDAVGSGKISDGQVKAADIANGAITSDKLATAAAASVMNSSTEWCRRPPARRCTPTPSSSTPPTCTTPARTPRASSLPSPARTS